MADAEDGDLALPADPQVAVFHQEVDAVLLVPKRELAHRLAHDAERLDADFEADRAALVLAHRARHLDGRLLRQVVGLMEGRLVDFAFEDDALNEAGAVAHLEKVQFALGAPVVQPALERDLFSCVSGDVGDVDVLSHGFVFLVS